MKESLGTALIDADVILYRVAHKFTREFDGSKFFSPEDLEPAKRECSKLIDEITSGALCTSTILAFSSAHNYRKMAVPTYKSNRRSGHKPDSVLMGALRAYMTSEYDTRVFALLEADDVLGIIGTSDPSAHVVLCTIDKDLDTIPGLHFRWHHPEWGVFVVDQEAAAYSLRYQLLVGDSTDGFPGIPRVGPKTAHKILEDPEFSSVLDEYYKRDLTLQDFEATHTQARILQATDVYVVNGTAEVKTYHGSYPIGRVDLNIEDASNAA